MKNKIYGLVAVIVLLCGVGAAVFFNSQETSKFKAAGNAVITFTTTAAYPLEDGTTSKEVLVTKEALETMSLPMFEENADKSFVGWKLESISFAETTKHPSDLTIGNIYQPYEILRQGFYEGDSASFSAVYATQGTKGTTDIYEKQIGSLGFADNTGSSDIGNTGSTRSTEDRTPSLSSISGLSAYLSAANIFVYPNPDASSSDLAKTYSLNSDGFKSALFDLYNVEASQSDKDYYIFLGGTVTGLSASVGAKTTDPADASEASFYALKDKIGSLTITGRLSTTSYTDPLTDTIVTTTPATAAARFSFDSQTEVNFGTDVELRNIYYLNASTLAANGNSLYLGGSSYGSVAANVYGGSADGSEVTAKSDAKLTVSSTGATSTWNIFGGSNGGEFTGDTDVFVRGTSNNLASLHGGSTNAGVVTGSTQVTVEKSTGTIVNLYGGSDSGTVTGSTNVAVNKAVTITSLYGGTATGTIGSGGAEDGTTLTLSGSAGIGTLYGASSGDTAAPATQGIINGNTKVVINSTTAAVPMIYGGTSAGKVNGDVSLVINGIYGTITTLYGGTDSGTITGSALTTINSANAITTFYGGSYSGTVSGSANVVVNKASGTIGTLYGGTNTGNIGNGTNVVINDSSAITTLSAGANSSGTITGDTNLVINGGSGTIGTIYGGTNAGTVNGNTHLTINKRSSTITNIYGGTNSGTINGNVANKIYATNTTNGYTIATIFRGGANSGTINGSIENFIAGYGSFTADFYGGSTTGNIGVEGQNHTINTIYDAGLFGSTDNHFTGGNATRGYIRASIKNTVRAGKTAAAGAIASFNAAAGDSVTALAISSSSSSGINSFATDDSTGRKAYAYNAAKNSSTNAALTVIAIGELDSHLLGGAFSNGGEDGYAHATGVKGYFEGDALLTVGILNGDDTRAGGYNYCTSIAGFYYVGDNLEYKVSASIGSSSTLRTYTQNDWDIFGGAARADSGTYSSYIYGNTSLVQNNVLARWTYGGGYYGCIDGNTSNTVNGGLVDTLEGGGYFTDRIWGNTTAWMNNGEVNFFFSGGGWNDDKIYGNAKAYCTGGIINCAIGGTYGYAARHTIVGNADVYVTGGNFSGYPSHGTRGFSGGVTNYGTIEGNSSLTLDLRNSSGFKLPSGISITGGRNYNAGDTTYLGTDENNTITLNIYTAPGNDVLNGATIYGDGGTNTSAGNTKSGKIIMNIDAPGSSIGNLYATQYSNISSNMLRRDVEINVLRAKSIGGLSGGNATDNITNTVASNASSAQKDVAVNLGTILAPNSETDYAVTLEDVNEQAKEELAADESAQPKNIAFSGVGLVNFTTLNIKNEFVALASGGNIKNGLNATAANHWNTYDKFGDVTVENGSGFGVTSANNLISVGKMTINGEGNVHSTAGAGIINLSSIAMDKDSRLTWHKQAGGASAVASKGTYFGSGNAYQVLTFTSSNAAGTSAVTDKALEITPFNFMGLEVSTGKTFVGDNDVLTSASSTAANQKEFGIMIPGSVIDYTVVADETFDEELDEMVKISNGKGDIMHDVDEVYEDNVDPTGDAIKVWGTEAAGTRVQTGRLIIPILTGNQITPTLTFTPDKEVTGSWIRNITVDSTDTTANSPFDWKLGEQSDSEPQTWTFNQGMENAGVAERIGNEYSYNITVIYSNQAEVTGDNVIISSEDAKNLTAKSKVEELQNIFGRPYLTSNLSDEDWEAINDGLAEDSDTPERYTIAYTATDADVLSGEDVVVNSKTERYNLIIVPDESVIATDKNFALYAHDASFLLYEAKNLSGQPALDERTGAIVIYADDADGSADGSADLADSYLTAIKGKTSADVVPIVYTTTSRKGEMLEKQVAIEITGALVLSKVPDVFDFGTKTTAMNEQTHWAALTAGTEEDRGWSDIVVSDTRGDGVEWTLSVKESAALKDPVTNLSLAGSLYYQDSANNVEQVLSGAAYNVLANGTNGSVLAEDYVKDYMVNSDWADGSKGIKLKVPVNKQIVGSYSGELEWTLTFEP